MEKIKENDIYRFSYSLEYKDKAKHFDPYHCFDGQLVAKKDKETGEITLVDTYWSFGGNDSRYAKPKEWREKGTLTFFLNLDEVEKAEEWERMYYNEKDFYNLSYQHGCYKKFAKRKGAKRDKGVMLDSLQEALKKAKYDADYAIRRVEEYSTKIAQVQNGDTTIYI